MRKLPTSIRTYANRIRAHWQRATASIMEVARLCAKANNRVSAAEKKQLVKVLPFSGPTFSKLAQIGDDRRLHSNRLQKLLPPSYSIIYSVGQLEDDELKAAIKDGIVTPTLKRSELAEWLQSKERRANTIKPRKSNLPDVFSCRNSSTHQPSPKQIERLDAMLDQIRSEFNAERIRPRDRYAEAMNCWIARVLRSTYEAKRGALSGRTKKRALSKRPAKKTHRKISIILEEGVGIYMG